MKLNEPKPDKKSWRLFTGIDKQTAELKPIQEHIVRLHGAISECTGQGSLNAHKTTARGWEGVRYALQMAAGLRSVVVDTTQVDETGAWAYCNAGADFDDAHSEVASSYMAALIVFNFIWTAYENAREISLFGALLTGKSRNKTKELSHLTGGLSDNLAFLRSEFYTAADLCHRGGGLNGELTRVFKNIDGSYAELCADLARRFRHHVYHGGDAVPFPEEEYGEPINKKTARAISPVVLRFSAVGRLLLMLIQLIALSCLDDPASLIRDEEHSDDEEREKEAGMVFADLHVAFTKAD